MTLRTLPLPLKVLATCFLLTIGAGYLFALAYLYLIDLEPHAQPRPSVVQAVIAKYYGRQEDSLLEAALKGSMGDRVGPGEKREIIRWVRAGAPEAEFVKIEPILKQSCASCHSAQSGLSIPGLSSYAEVSAYTGASMGQSLKSLVRVSHIHLFGMSFIFILTSLIFAFSELSLTLRSILIAIPFLAIWLDIGSWWFTTYQPIFAYTVIAGGALMGLSLAGQITISLYELWFRQEGKMEI
ncbi:MAG TPA: hypothetical protein VFD86_03785 [Nitrospira sp.]|jgi:hypothetical protein|nr:hypothetical protein [Nitrospira sp.]